MRALGPHTPVLLALLILAPSAMAQTAEQMRFYGVELGKPLPSELRDCPKERDILNRNVWRYPIFGPNFVCAEAYPDSPGNGRAMLRLPQSPPHVKNGMIELTIVDSLVQAAQVTTPGLLSQGDVLTELVQKYGEPTQRSTSIAVDSAGATFENVSANWDISNSLQIHFRGMLARKDEGFLIVGTKRGMEEYKSRQAESTRRTQLGPAM